VFEYNAQNSPEFPHNAPNPDLNGRRLSGFGTGAWNDRNVGEDGALKAGPEVAAAQPNDNAPEVGNAIRWVTDERRHN
jgi:hypothetical protein